MTRREATSSWLPAEEDWLQAWAIKYAKLCDQETKSGLETGYACAVIVREVLQAKRYGRKGVKEIANVCRRSTKRLYRQGKVAERFPQDAFYEACASAKEAGYAITFSHFEELATVESADVRDALLREAIEHRWEVRALKRAVAVRTGKAEAAPKRRMAGPGEASPSPDPFVREDVPASHATRAERIRALIDALDRETEGATDEETEEVRPDLEREMHRLRRKLGGGRTRRAAPASRLGLADLSQLVSSLNEAVRTIRDSQGVSADPSAAASSS